MRKPDLGNPLQSEVSAFRWLVVVLIAGATVVIVAKLISARAGIIYGTILLLLVAILIIRGVAHLLGSPDEDQDDGKIEDPDRKA